MINLDPLQIAPGSQRRLHVDEYHRMIDADIFSEDERIELLEGVLIRMTPQSSAHANLIQKLNALLVRGVGPEHDVRVQLPLTVGTHSEPEPDFAVVPARETWNGGHPTTAALVIEVAVTSLRLDIELKSALYARAGVTEYWVINVKERSFEVFREPDATSGLYQKRETFRRGTLKPEALPGPELDLELLFASALRGSLS